MGPKKSFGTAEVSIFLLALVGGTLCSLSSKVMLTMKGTGMGGYEEPFSFPLFQTFGMFLGMLAALLMHYLVQRFKIPFPGYPGYRTPSEDSPKEAPPPEPIPMWKLAALIIPSVFDLTASALAMFGLRHVDVSIYQMLRGSAIIFVALLKQFMLHHPLERFKWIGIAFNVLSIVLVGMTALLSHSNSDEGRGDSRYSNSPMTGVVLILCGAFVQALQYAFEEKVMNDADTAIPPLLLIGMEGFWGTILCVVLLYPAAYFIPGQDHGSLENGYNTYVMFTQNTHIQSVFLLYFLSVLQYNILAVLVTYMLDSVWHAILDNFRPVTVWATDLLIFYHLSKSFGEPWTNWSYLQLVGMFVLLYGTAIYNAPNAGSLKLTGDWKSLGFDCRDEYQVTIPRTDDNTFVIVESQVDCGGNRQFNSVYRESIQPLLLLSPVVANREHERREQARQKEREQELSLLSSSFNSRRAAAPRGGGGGGGELKDDKKLYGSLEV